MGQLVPDNFWTQPARLVGTVSAVIMMVVFLIVDENTVAAKILGGSDAISLIVALVLYIKEAPDRRKAKSVVHGHSNLGIG